MKLKSTTLAFATILCSLSAAAAEFSGLKVSGEASFDYNYLSSGDNRYPAAGGATSDTYRFNQAQLLLTKETDQISFLARLNYAPTDYMQSSTASAKASFGTLDQLEIFYKIRPDFSIGFGRLSTTLGLESYMKSENVLFGNTISYQGILPGYGEGLRAKYTPGDWLNLTLSTYNRIPNAQFGDDNTPTKTTELSATGTTSDFTWFAGGVMGTDGDGSVSNPKIDRTASSIWMTYRPYEELTFSAFYDTRSQKPLGGSSIYAQSLSGILSYSRAKNTIALRYESVLGAGELDTMNGTVSSNFYPGADKVQVWTIGDSYAVSEFMKVYLEYRHDDADQEVLRNNKGDATKELHLITLGAVAHF
ncbi:outer membrane beta-barrel protein [Bdellovibrio svalbardensis]|uniref:Outer membrane beta-barrel protein n=1 Tax=Bdellovibrio svalbardensis TaxID=2972972 RepID=A0ABT6DKA4_9BACT|nr:outer membrane beta-barrel protein [Bdellovibrio svalbardensis]MDG0817298.1 outer membrane beta-barrel protein [Bdellovibrio svalbardensis]